MKERPILFSAPMVRAILDGRKSQTRRIVKPSKDVMFGCVLMPNEIAGEINNGDYENSRYGKPGDRLWVRETFKAIASGEVKNGYGKVRYGFAYKADSATIWNKHPTIIYDLTGQPPSGPMQFNPVTWKPSIHMPRRASRILLEVTGIRVERLNDISESDANAEGCDEPARDQDWTQCRRWYRSLWDQINGTGSWEANPWVWVIEFKRIDNA